MGEPEKSIQECLARALLSYLSERFQSSQPAIEFTIWGTGRFWEVLASAGPRSCRILCSNFESEGLSRIARLRQRASSEPADSGDLSQTYPGAEFLVIFRDESDHQEGKPSPILPPEGRFYASAAVAKCIQRWVVSMASKEDIYEAFSCVDICRRTLQEVTDQIDRIASVESKGVRVKLIDDRLGDPKISLVVEGVDRAVEFDACSTQEDGLIQCTLIFGLPIGTLKTDSSAEAAHAAHSWVVDEVSELELFRLFPKMLFTDFVDEIMRGDFFGLHWKREIKCARVERESADGYYAACFLPLLERIEEDARTRRFYSFYSMGRLCFSRCSKFPFATAGLPVVQASRSAYPEPAGYWATCGEESVKGDVDEIFEFLKQRLSAITESGVYGNCQDALFLPAKKLLDELGSRIYITRRDLFGGFTAAAPERGRHCTLNFSRDPSFKPYLVSFESEEERTVGHGQFSVMTSVVDALRGWLELKQNLIVIATLADKFEICKDD